MTSQTRRGWRNRVLTRRSPRVRVLPHGAWTSGHPSQGQERRGTLAAEAQPASVLIRRDATRTGAGHLVFPFEPCPDQLRTRLPSPPQDERDRSFRGELALACVARAQPCQLSRTLLQPLPVRRASPILPPGECRAFVRGRAVDPRLAPP